jgi:hypothetical protein
VDELASYLTQLQGRFGKPVEIFVQLVPPFVVLKTLLPEEYPEKVTIAVSGSVGLTSTRVMEADPTGSVPVTVVQDVPPLVVL